MISKKIFNSKKTPKELISEEYRLNNADEFTLILEACLHSLHAVIVQYLRKRKPIGAFNDFMQNE